jgi:hypothetical protein
MKNPAWLESSKLIEELVVEVGFRISDSFYYGSRNASKQQWEELSEPLYQPQLHSEKGLILTDVLESDIDELVKYYVDVFRLSEKYQCPMSKSYFWMSPVIYSDQDVEIHFPWHDTWKETKDFLEAVSASKDGYLFIDADQDWDLDIYGISNQLFVREGALRDAGKPLEIVCDRQCFVDQVGILYKRSEQIVHKLCSALGGDYWTPGNLEWENALSSPRKPNSISNGRTIEPAKNPYAIMMTNQRDRESRNS